MNSSQLIQVREKLESDSGDAGKLLEHLNSLSSAEFSVKDLIESKLGNRVKKLKKHENVEVANTASSLMLQWAEKHAKEATKATGTVANAGDEGTKRGISSPSSSSPGKRKRGDSDSEAASKSLKASGASSAASPRAPTSGRMISSSSMVTGDASSTGVAEALETAGVTRKPAYESAVMLSDDAHGQKRARCVDLMSDSIRNAFSSDARKDSEPVQLKSIVTDEKDEKGEGLPDSRDSEASRVSAAFSDEEIRIACSHIENELFKKHDGMNREYNVQLRSLIFNLKNGKNRALRERVLEGSLPASELVHMTPNELADEEMQKKRQEMAEYHKKAAMSELPGEKGNVTGMFKCHRCKKRETTFTQAQTRSADEPMTVFVTCLNCGNRWKC